MRARVVCHCAYRDEVSRCRNGPLTYTVVDTRRTHVQADERCIELGHITSNDTLLPLGHHLKLLNIIDFSIILLPNSKVINFVVDSPARKMKANN